MLPVGRIAIQGRSTGSLQVLEIWESTVFAKSVRSAKSGLEATAIMSCCVSYRQQEAANAGLT